MITPDTIALWDRLEHERRAIAIQTQTVVALRTDLPDAERIAATLDSLKRAVDVADMLEQKFETDQGTLDLIDAATEKLIRMRGRFRRRAGMRRSLAELVGVMGRVLG